MKKILSAALLVSGLLLSTACNVMQGNGNCVNETGNLKIKFDLSETAGSKAMTFDFSQVYGGKAFLQQKETVQYQTELTIDNLNKTGEGGFSDIIIGKYDVILELYDSSAAVVYSGISKVTVLTDNSNAVITDLTKNAVSLSVTGYWTEDIPNLTTGIIKLKKNVIFSYAGNLVIDADKKKANGYILNIQPGIYDVYIEIYNQTGGVCFAGMKTVVIDKENTTVIFGLRIMTGDILISAAGDVSAPVITSPPDDFISGTDAIITWETDENATSNVCYSTESGFKYQLSTNWAPVGQDITADNTIHTVTIRGLLPDQTYYYVVASMDSAGNMVVSDEYSLAVSAAD